MTGPGLIRFLKGNMARGKDQMLISEGPEGAGKSTTTDNIARHLDASFNLRTDPIMNMDQLLDVLHRAEEGRLYVLDEAVNIFHNQDWATWEAKSLSKILRQMRIMRSTWFLNCPDFQGLHPYIRDYRSRIRLYHRPVFDPDGMSNGPPQVLWKTERFDYKENEVKGRWRYLFDLETDCLDADPQWAGYEERKRVNFRELVEEMMQRRNKERQRDARKDKRETEEPSMPPLLLRSRGAKPKKRGPRPA